MQRDIKPLLHEALLYAMQFHGADLQHVRDVFFSQRSRRWGVFVAVQKGTEPYGWPASHRP